MVYRKDYRLKRKRDVFRDMRNWSVTTWLIIVNVFVSVIGFLLWQTIPESINWFALKPISILQGKYLWTLVLHMFSHGGFAHLLINMFVLFSLGKFCEKIIGRKRYFWFYLISGIFAGILSVVLSGFFGTGLGERIFGSPEIFMVGASGAIFAIAGLYVVLLPRLKFFIIFLPFFGLPAFIMIPGVLFLMWGLSIVFGWPIGNVAHFGGFLSGVVYGLYLRRKYSRKIRMLQRYVK